MGKKYSINSAGNIVAERDIYSLGGYIPKGQLGGKIANELQLSQDGECWLGSGNISANENVRIRDNAFVRGLNVSASAQGDVFTFDGNTFVGGVLNVSVDTTRGHKSDLLVRNSFIGTEMDVLCGPATNTEAFPFEQGRFVVSAPKGTAFTSSAIIADASDVVRGTATLRVGRKTYIYTPPGYNCSVLWAYVDAADNLVYAGEFFGVTQALTELNHPTYKLAKIMFGKVGGLTPAQLGDTGARVIGHVSSSIPISFKPASASGSAVMENSAISIQTTNFGLSLNAIRWLAGELINTDVYTVDRVDLKVFGTFRNVGRLEYHWYIADSQLSRADRDTFVRAYDCPLLRLHSDTFGGSIWDAGSSLILRNCVVPKAMFTHNKVLGDTYENIDFSYAQEHIGEAISGRTSRSSHLQGHYDLFSLSPANELTGVISRPENLDNTARLTEAHISVQLDGDLMEQGSYQTGGTDYYENYKTDSPIRVRIKKPLPTRGAVFPSLPSNYRMKAVLYLDDAFIVRSSETDVTELKDEYPYFVASFRKEDDSAITVKEFISKSLFIQRSDYTKYPIVSGSGFVGAGVTVRGDVQVIGQPYLDRTLDRNLFEIGGTLSSAMESGWEAAKTDQTLYTGVTRTRLKETYPVEPGDKLSCADGYFFICYYFREDGSYLSGSAWGTSFTVPDGAASVGILTSKGATQAENAYITLGDMGPMHVRLLRPFKKARYITNELDRKDPNDILLGPDYWENGAFNTTAAYLGKPYKDLKYDDANRIRLKVPINAGTVVDLSSKDFWDRAFTSFDGGTNLIAWDSKVVLIAGTLRKAPPSAISPADVTDARLILEYTPSPRIVMPYGSTAMLIREVKVRLYDNAVINKAFEDGKEVILTGNAVFGRASGFIDCVCANGHDDAIIKLP